MLTRGHITIQVNVGAHKSEYMPARLTTHCDAVEPNMHRPLARTQQAGDDPQQRRFTRAVAPGYEEDISIFQVCTNALQNPPHPVGLAYMVNLQADVVNTHLTIF
jgi:hypothetical protein